MRNPLPRLGDEPDWRAIAENVPEALFRSTPDGRLLAGNAALAQLLGYASPQALRAACGDVAAVLYARPADRREFMARMERDGQVRDFETDYRRADGSVGRLAVSASAAVDAELRIAHFDGCVRDVSDRLARHERYFHDVVESSTDVILVLDERLRYQYVNRALHDVLGYWPEELLNVQPFSLIHAEDREPVRREVAAALADPLQPRAAVPGAPP